MKLMKTIIVLFIGSNFSIRRLTRRAEPKTTTGIISKGDDTNTGNIQFNGENSDGSTVFNSINSHDSIDGNQSAGLSNNDTDVRGKNNFKNRINEKSAESEVDFEAANTVGQAANAKNDNSISQNNNNNDGSNTFTNQ